jgi:hypothetical protein
MIGLSQAAEQAKNAAELTGHEGVTLVLAVLGALAALIAIGVVVVKGPEFIRKFLP